MIKDVSQLRAILFLTTGVGTRVGVLVVSCHPGSMTLGATESEGSPLYFHRTLLCRVEIGKGLTGRTKHLKFLPNNEFQSVCAYCRTLESALYFTTSCQRDNMMKGMKLNSNQHMKIVTAR
jgi:hypothetical protein